MAVAVFTLFLQIGLGAHIESYSFKKIAGTNCSGTWTRRMKASLLSMRQAGQAASGAGVVRTASV